MFLASSSIETIDEGAWNSDSLVDLQLNDNFLTTLTKDLIKNGGVSLGNNR